jgi:probable phosphoglycerate mutase
MILYYVRHGDPIYDPDSLTPLGQRQAEAVAKRFAVYGLDKIYASTSNRAIQTAKPTCEMLKLEAELLDFANESHAWEELTVDLDGGRRTWLFHHNKTAELFNTKEIRDLGDRWYDHPELRAKNYKAGMERICNGTDELLLSLGYEHERYTGKYKVVAPNDKRVALFAHQGFGLAFLSALLDIPYPMISTHFDMCHTGITAIEFRNGVQYSIPRVLTLSSEAHIFKEGLPLKYNNSLRY